MRSSLHEIHKPDSLEVLFVVAHISSPKLLIQDLERRVYDYSHRGSFSLIHIVHFNFRVRELCALTAYSTRLSVAENT
jgi:hypothetical protein